MLYIRIQLFKTRKSSGILTKTNFKLLKSRTSIWSCSILKYDFVSSNESYKFLIIQSFIITKNDEEPNLEIFNCETLFVQKRIMIVKNHFPWRLRIHQCTNKIAFSRKSTFLNYHTFVFHSFIHITCEPFWVRTSDSTDEVYVGIVLTC